jgi:hypothetical protein
MNTATLINRSLSSRTGQGMLVIFDAAVPHRSHLEAGILPGATHFTLAPDRDGIAQITDYLRSHSGFTSVHLISHGAPGRLYLGSTRLDRDTLPQYQDALSTWRTAFSDRFELLLYGCQVGYGAIGWEFVEALGRATGAIAAANPTYTGSSHLGGTWTLSTQTAPIQSAIALTPDTQATYPALLVSTVSELRQAIIDANNNPGADTITLTNTFFNLPDNVLGGQDFTIFGATGLPLITDDLTITSNSKATIQRDNGAGPFRIMAAISSATNPQVNVTLNNLIIRNGLANGANPFGDDGGGILNVGSNVTIRNSDIRSNTAADDGGGILNVSTNEHGASLIIEDSIIADNTVTGTGPGNDGPEDGGAGIASDSGTRSGGQPASLTLTRVSVTGNTATTGSGGGIQVADGGSISLDSVSITGNNSASVGAGIALVDTSKITISKIVNSTIKDNAGTGQDIESSYYAALKAGLDPASLGLVAPDIPTEENLVGNDIPFEETADSGSNIPGIPFAPLNPTVFVAQLGGTTITDGTTFNLTVVAGQSLPPFSFLIRNVGQNDLSIIQEPDSDNDVDFNLVSSTAPFANPLPGLGSPSNPNTNPDIERFDLNLTGDTTQVGDIFSTRISFDVANPDLNSDVVNSVSSDGEFDFTLNVSVVAPPANASPLQVDPTTSLFTAGVGSGDRVKISVLNAPQGGSKSSIQELNITYVSGGNLNEQLFSVLPVLGQPNGFGVGLQTFLLENVDNKPFAGNETFKIELGDRNIASQINVNAGGNGIHDIIFDTNSDGQFVDSQDLTLRVNQTNEVIPLGVGTVQANDLELIDLRRAADNSTALFGNRTATFNLFREANFNNTVGLYRIDDVNGRVGELLPGAAGYARAAIENRVSGINLAVGNGATASASGSLTGGELYAPFIVVDSSIEAYLSGSGGQAYFSYASANSDGVDHVILLGNNTFGFEDLVGGGDRDFNDLIFQVDIV